MVIIDIVCKFSKTMNDFFGFWIAILTLIAAVNIKSRIMTSNEKKDLFIKLPKITKIFEGYISVLEQSNLSETNIQDLDTFLCRLSIDYSFTSICTKRTIKKARSLLLKKKIDRLKLKECLIEISSYYKKEVDYENTKL